MSQKRKAVENPVGGAGSGIGAGPGIGAGSGIGSRLRARPAGDSDVYSVQGVASTVAPVLSSSSKRPPLAPPSGRKKEPSLAHTAAAAPVVVATPPPPSLHDLLTIPRFPATSGSFSPPAFMDAASTWPNTRVDVLKTVAEEIQVRIPYHSIPRWGDVFVAKLPALAKGASGVVYRTCVNMAALGPDKRVCKRFSFPSIDRVHMHRVPLIIKNMVLQDTRDRPEAGEAPFSCWSRGGECTGFDNMIREALLGSFLNLLVKKQVTPHLPVIYKCFSSTFIETEEPKRGREPRYTKGAPCGAIVTEMCHLTFPQYVDTLVTYCARAEDIPVLLNVALIQIVHGIMSAQTHFNFRHNDFHGHNAMMTYITAGEYRYAVDGVRYDVPNYGMCWKMIDFGFSSSTELFGCHDNGSMLVCSHALSVADSYGFDPVHHATEMYDLVRFMSYMRLVAMSRRDKDAGDEERRVRWDSVVEYFTHNIFNSRAIKTRESHTAVLSVPISTAQYGNEEDKRRYARMEEGNAHNNLVRHFFKAIAKPFKNAAPVPDAYDDHVFDVDRVLFTPRERLDSFASKHFRVDDSGKLVSLYPLATI